MKSTYLIFSTPFRKDMKALCEAMLIITGMAYFMVVAMLVLEMMQ